MSRPVEKTQTLRALNAAEVLPLREITSLLQREWPFWIAIVAIVAANCSVLYRNPLNHDVSWYIYVANQMLAGKKLYVDMVETNPPLASALCLIPAFLAHLTGLTTKIWWIILSTIVLTGFALVSARLLSQACRMDRPAANITRLYLVVILLVPSVYEFGQRDRLAFASCLPLFLLLACRIHSIPLSRNFIFGLSIASGVFIALKPFFLIPWLLYALFGVWQLGFRKALRLPENYIVPGLSAAQLLLTAAFTPEYFAIARVLLKHYRGFDVSIAELILSPELGIPLIGAVACMFYRSKEPARTPIRALALLTIGWVASAVAQHKGFSYQVLPAATGLEITVYAVVIDMVRNGNVLRNVAFAPRPAIELALALGISIYGLSTMLHKWGYWMDTGRLIPILEQDRNNRPVLFLSTGSLGFPLVVERNINYGGSFLHLWILPDLYLKELEAARPGQQLKYHAPEVMDPAERALIDMVYSDLARRPLFIVVDADEEKFGFRETLFDLEEYFQGDRRIKDIWSEYRQIYSDLLFHVYKRTESR